jgi:hypothetical protein
VKAKALAFALLLGCAALASAQEAPKPPPFTFALHGFVSMSGCMQDGIYELSECQQSLMSRAEPTTDANSLTFDVRQSRFNFSVKGPPVILGATPTAVLELDFFGGFSSGAFGNASLFNRLRLAYSELNWGSTRVAFGQLNDLTFAMAPVSLSHIAFPIGYATGNIGWRRPGIWAFHNLALAPDMKLELAGMVGRSSYQDAAAAVGDNYTGRTNRTTFGEASGLPALEARATITFKTLLTAFVSGHWNRVDLNGLGTSGSADIDVAAVNGGAKVVYGPLTVAATAFTGKNTGPLLGNLVQVPIPVTAAAGPPAVPALTLQTIADTDVNSFGYWAQVGFNFTKELSAWGFYGQQKPDQADAKKLQFARLDNKTTNVMLQYREGGYGLSVEWLNFKTTNAAYDGTSGAFTAKTDVTTNQYIATATYFF